MAFSIYYQNVRGLRTKSHEIFSATLDAYYDIIALTETWLSDIHVSSDFFPDVYSVYRADRTYLELTNECVWVEIRMPGRRNILIGSHYFHPGFSPILMEKYLDELEPVLDAYNYEVFMLGDFNASKVNWSLRSFLSNTPSTSKQKAISIFKFIDETGLSLALSPVVGLGDLISRGVTIWVCIMRLNFIDGEVSWNLLVLTLWRIVSPQTLKRL